MTWTLYLRYRNGYETTHVLGSKPLLPPPIKVVHVPESISQDEADQIRRAVEQIETVPLGRAWQITEGTAS